jgi:hypothetical protein
MGILVWVGVILLFVVVPLLPVAIAIMACIMVHKNKARPWTITNGLWIALIIICLSPYAHHLASLQYRNNLCESEGLTTINFDPKRWATENPAEASEVRNPTDKAEYLQHSTRLPLNSRFVEVSNFSERGMSVHQIHRQIIDSKTSAVIAETKMFMHGSGGRGNPFPIFDNFTIKPLRSCYTRPEYDSLIRDLHGLIKSKSEPD